MNDFEDRGNSDGLFSVYAEDGCEEESGEEEEDDVKGYLSSSFREFTDNDNDDYTRITVNVEEKEKQEECFPNRPSTEKQVNRLTMELFANTTHYKKYLAKHNIDDDDDDHYRNTEKEEEMLFELDRLCKFRPFVDQLIQDMLDDFGELNHSSNLANTEIQYSFTQCVKRILDFLDWTHYKDPTHGCYEHDDIYDRGAFEPSLPPHRQQQQQPQKQSHFKKMNKPKMNTNGTAAAAACALDPFSFPCSKMEKQSSSSSSSSSSAASFWGKPVKKT